jgi:hypothetical protein
MVNIYFIRKYIAFLAGTTSKTYKLVHGAGFRLNGQGVLLIGNSGTGKSTLTALFDEAEILDDDLLLASERKMRRVAKSGVRISPDDKNKLVYLDDGNDQSPISYVFVLNNQHEPDYVQKIKPAAISPEITFDNKLDGKLFSLYSGRMPVLFAAPVYEIGTRREPAESKRTIESLLS